jgi:hypothetical protein
VVIQIIPGTLVNFRINFPDDRQAYILPSHTRLATYTVILDCIKVFESALSAVAYGFVPLYAGKRSYM